MYSCFRPGKTWYDTDGKPIQAHGGSILFANDTFYWYGENKEGITGRATGTACRYWHHGVKLYSSKDLYNWKDEGLIMPESADENNPFYPRTYHGQAAHHIQQKNRNVRNVGENGAGKF